MKAAWISHALVAVSSIPAVVACAFVGSIAVSVLLVASGPAAGGIAVVALPSREADALAGRAAAVMAEIVVPRPTQILTALPVVVRHAGHPVLVHHLRVRASVLVLGPVRSDVQPFLSCEPRYQHFVERVVRRVVCVVISLHYQREGARPRELKWKSDWIGETRHGDVGAQIDDVLAQYGCDDVAVCARRRRVDLHLILFQANPEPGFANARALARLGRAAGTALAQTVFSVLVHERLQPQLEHPRGVYRSGFWQEHDGGRPHEHLGPHVWWLFDSMFTRRRYVVGGGVWTVVPWCARRRYLLAVNSRGCIATVRGTRCTHRRILLFRSEDEVDVLI